MAKQYVLKFGSGDPTAYTGLAPTMTVFSAGGLTSLVGPGISEIIAGQGLYFFSYGPTQSITFKADGGAALAAGDRYIVGVLDPLQAVDEKLGNLTDSYGSTSADPGSVLGYLKRNQEFQEGNAVFTKSTGIWDIYSRGSTTLLREKALTNTTSAAGKT
jgi:hypothetical protein